MKLRLGVSVPGNIVGSISAVAILVWDQVKEPLSDRLTFVALMTKSVPEIETSAELI